MNCHNHSSFRTVLALALALGSIQLQAANWPVWRGDIAGSGIAREKNIPTQWSATENVRWKVELPAPGNSSPVVWNDKVFIAQASADGTRRDVVCYRRTDGRKLWESGTTYTEPEDSHDTNPQCSASPVTDGERVVAWFGSAGLFCFDLQGKEIWRRDLGKQKHEWGYGGSPLLYGDLCILHFGPGERAFLIAVDKRTGKTVWQVDIPQIHPTHRTDGFAGRTPGIVGSWSTPILINAAGRDELVMTFPEKVRAFDPLTGKELWFCDGLNPLVYTSPIYGEGLVVAMGGFSGNHLAVRPGGNGNVTETHRVWHQTRAKSGIGSGVISNGHIYLMSGPIVYCWELATGKLIWEERVTGAGASSESWSSMVLAEDRIYVLNHSSETVVLRASPRFEKIVINPLAGERTNSSIAASNGELFIRTHKHLWCIGAAKTETNKAAGADAPQKGS